VAKARKQGRIGGRRALVLDRERITLDEQGLTLREIAGELGVSTATLCRILKAYRRKPVVQIVWLDADGATPAPDCYYSRSRPR
jgi:hypothetical protein